MFKLKSGTKFVYSIRGHNNFYYPDLENSGFLTKDCVAVPMNWVCSSHSAVIVPIDGDDSGPKIPIWIEKDLFNSLKNSNEDLSTPDDEFISLKTLNKIIGIHVSRWIEDQVLPEFEAPDLEELVYFSRDNFTLDISSNSEIKCPQCLWGGSQEHLELRFTAKLCPICRVVLVNR